ncbi:MAG TPA: cytochrome b [Bradyrhizobium sp.]|jgi:cytochrome b561|uniref:cytochrome b n=1 Tax=Bradyrhizobium sp. TaxID=376 RepID=UPI002C1F237F|nr:cytochrome b [Bradyrhizobium sp.]HXB78809.1 cytochrome b [Bradyrhizobium sp.]
MTENSESAKTYARTAGLESGRFDQISITLHWLTVLLIVLQFSSAWLREAVDHDSSLAVTILTTHRTSGALIWVVSLVRLVWRHNFAYLPPFPESMSKLQQTLAKANEYSLYALLLIQPITGLGRSLFRGAPFELFIWQVPALFEQDDAIRHVFAEAHEIGANVLLALIGLHAGTALFHRLFLRDGVLQRMLPWTSQSVGARQSNVQLAVSDAE